MCLTALLAFACEKTQEEPVPDTPEEPIEQPETPVEPEPEPEPGKPQPGVYNFVLGDDCAGKTAWEEGDQIYLDGGYTPEAMTITVKASDISADGKTASINLESVPEAVYPPDNYYAAYPASAVSTESFFCDDEFEFIPADGFLMCAWLSGNSFEFHGLCARVAFSVQGDYDSCVFCGPNWEYVCYDSFGVKANSESQNYSMKFGASHYYLNKDITDGEVSLFFPAGLTMENGFRIFLKKDGAYPKVFVSPEALSLDRNSVLDLGDITAMLEDYEGEAPEAPVMPEIGGYEKFTTSLTEISGICLSLDNSFLWAVGDQGDLAQISFEQETTVLWNNGNDLEGITIHPETGDLYVAVEGSQKVCRIAAPDYGNSMETVFTVKDAANYGNSGLEGITFYKDTTLYVGSQVGANVWRYNLQGEVLSMVSLKKLSTAVKEVGGLFYDPLTDWLWVTDSEAHKLFVFDGELTHLLASYPVPYISNNESVCVDHDHECVWVGCDDDTPRVFRIEFTGLNNY